MLQVLATMLICLTRVCHQARISVPNYSAVSRPVYSVLSWPPRVISQGSSGQSGAAYRVSAARVIEFKRTICVVDTNGQCELMELDDTEKGTISVEPLKLSKHDAGRTKDVFKVGPLSLSTVVFSTQQSY